MEQDKLPVKDYDGWFRNSHSGSFDNSDTAKYQKYMATHRARQKQDAQQASLQKDVSELKSEMSELKALLLTLVQNQK